jgi:O-antigen/teichoic acid export membrane protein
MIERLLRRTGLVMLGTGFSKGLLLVLELFIARALGAAGYGAFSLGLATLFVVANAALLGLNFGVIQYLSVHQEEQRPDLVRGVLRTSLVVTALTGVVAGAAVWLAADFLAIRVFSKPELAQALRIIALAIPFETMNQNLSAGFRGLRRFRDHVMVSDLWRNALALTAVLVLSLRKLELVPVLWVLVLGTAAATLIGLWRMREALAGNVDGSLNHHAARLLRFSYLLIGWNLFQQLAGRGLLLLSGIFLSSADVGILSAFTRLLLLFTFFQSGINQTTPVEFARLHHLGDRAQMQRTFAGLTLALLIAGTATALPLVVAPPVLLASLVRNSARAAGGWCRWSLHNCSMWGPAPRGSCSLPATGSVKCSSRRSPPGSPCCSWASPSCHRTACRGQFWPGLRPFCCSR